MSSHTLNGLSRRAALLAGLTAGAASCATPGAAPAAFDGPVAFEHGVASGDPGRDRVVIWTRVTTAPDARVPVRWIVARDPGLKDVVAQGDADAAPERDHTVKADVQGLQPGRIYHYGFKVGATASPVGRTKTLPREAPESVRLAVASCSNYPFGFFNAYAEIAKTADLDAVLHLGDYLYEYGPTGYGGAVGEKLGRAHTPAKEILTLADYRARHAQYKSDPDLQAAHAAAPWITVWDDHESANDSYVTGAQNHDPASEGDWSARKAAALQAYYEWMPIREPAPGGAFEAINRSFAWGDLATLVMLETRLLGRQKPLSYATDLAPYLPNDIEGFKREKLNDPSRQLLGERQEAWLKDTLANSKTAWRVIGSQILMAELLAPDLSGLPEALIAQIETEAPWFRQFVAVSRFGLPTNLDAWDGYPAQRARVLEALKSAGASIVVTGDTHAAWASELGTANKGARAAVEFGGTSVTSPSVQDQLPAIDLASILDARNEELKWADQRHRGFLLVTLTREAAEAEFVKVSTVVSKAYERSAAARFRVRREANGAIGPIEKLA